MGRLAYIAHPYFEKHNPGSGHPERPERLAAINSYLDRKGFWPRVQKLQPESIDSELLKLNHDPEYIDFILKQKGKERVVLDGGDTVLSTFSVEAALLAAGAAVRSVEAVFREDFDKVFAAVRPPGHHAEREQAMGFCVFNNIAIAARYAIQQKYAQKILIVDWDVHHGNGTQHAFYDDDSVFYFSIHQYPLFPMTGLKSEIGEGKGKGFTRNIPLPYGRGDDEYIVLLERSLEEIGQKFAPDLVLISAGFDAHKEDPLGGMQVTTAGFYKMTELVSQFANRFCQGRIISFLEGGYDLNALAESVYRHLLCLLKH